MPKIKSSIGDYIKDTIRNSVPSHFTEATITSFDLQINLICGGSIDGFYKNIDKILSDPEKRKVYACSTDEKSNKSYINMIDLRYGTFISFKRKRKSINYREKYSYVDSVCRPEPIIIYISDINPMNLATPEYENSLTVGMNKNIFDSEYKSSTRSEKRNTFRNSYYSGKDTKAINCFSMNLEKMLRDLLGDQAITEISDLSFQRDDDKRNVVKILNITIASNITVNSTPTAYVQYAKKVGEEREFTHRDPAVYDSDVIHYKEKHTWMTTFELYNPEAFRWVFDADDADWSVTVSVYDLRERLKSKLEKYISEEYGLDSAHRYLETVIDSIPENTIQFSLTFKSYDNIPDMYKSYINKDPLVLIDNGDIIDAIIYGDVDCEKIMSTYISYIFGDDNIDIVNSNSISKISNYKKKYIMLFDLDSMPAGFIRTYNHEDQNGKLTFDRRTLVSIWNSQKE